MDSKIVSGYAIKWFSISTHLRDKNTGDNFVEQFSVRAFSNDRFNHVRALVDHDSTKQVGSTNDGNLKIWADSIGLRYSLNLNDDYISRRLWVEVLSGNVTGISIGFNLQDCVTNNSNSIRLVTSAILNEISIIIAPKQPAYSDTTLQVCR